MNHEERQLLDEALIQAYKQRGITHNNESQANPERYQEMPVLDISELTGDLLTVGMFVTLNYAEMLANSNNSLSSYLVHKNLCCLEKILFDLERSKTVLVKK